MLRIGLLGASGIAPHAVIAPARRRDDVDVVAVAAQEGARAQAYAAEHGIPRALGGYQRLLEDPEVDLVYVGLPPFAHAQWSIRALEAGKHVLCEKPFAMDAAEAQAMVAAAERSGSRLIEAQHARYHPVQAAVREAVVSGRLGEIVSARSVFLTSDPYDPRRFRHVPQLGGGALMDLGVYALHWLRTAFDQEPSVRSATARLNPLGADREVVAELSFPACPRATVHATMDHAEFVATIEIVGSRGRLEAGNMVLPHLGHRVVETVDGLSRTRTLEARETYDHQMAAVLHALLTGTPALTEGGDPVASMAAVDAIYAAAGVERAGARDRDG